MIEKQLLPGYCITSQMGIGFSVWIMFEVEITKQIVSKLTGDSLLFPVRQKH